MKGNVRNEHTRIHSGVFKLPHQANLPNSIFDECRGHRRSAPTASLRLHRVRLEYVRFQRPDLREAVPTPGASGTAATHGVSGGMRSEPVSAAQLLSSGLHSMLAMFATKHVMMCSTEDIVSERSVPYDHARI